MQHTRSSLDGTRRQARPRGSAPATANSPALEGARLGQHGLEPKLVWFSGFLLFLLLPRGVRGHSLAEGTGGDCAEMRVSTPAGPEASTCRMRACQSCCSHPWGPRSGGREQGSDIGSVPLSVPDPPWCSAGRQETEEDTRRAVRPRAPRHMVRRRGAARGQLRGTARPRGPVVVLAPFRRPHRDLVPPAPRREVALPAAGRMVAWAGQLHGHGPEGLAPVSGRLDRLCVPEG